MAEIDGEEVAIPGAENENTPLDSDDPVAIRVWEAHPHRHLEAHSAVGSSLGLLEELMLLNAAVAAIEATDIPLGPEEEPPITVFVAPQRGYRPSELA